MAAPMLAPPQGATDPDALFDAYAEWTAGQGLELYPAQAEALIELVSGSNVILSTPTGSGKSLVATGALFAALSASEHRSDEGARSGASWQSASEHRSDSGAPAPVGNGGASWQPASR